MVLGELAGYVVFGSSCSYPAAKPAEKILYAVPCAQFCHCCRGDPADQCQERDKNIGNKFSVSMGFVQWKHIKCPYKIIPVGKRLQDGSH